MVAAGSDRTGQLAEWLCAMREERGVSQDVLADRLGVAQSVVSRVERGHRRVSVPELFAWAEALGLSWDDLTAGLRGLWAGRAK